MGLTVQAIGRGAALQEFKQIKKDPGDITVAFAGNPNVGKSTLFNGLTGLKQHTGNWPGKTVCNAVGRCKGTARNLVLVDLPGTYSLHAASEEERVARDYLCFGQPDVTVVVCDAACLERNLNLELQILEISRKTVVCVNLLDEAEKRGITVNLKRLSDRLGVPVVGTVAQTGQGLKELVAAIKKVANGFETGGFGIAYPKNIEAAVQNLLQLPWPELLPKRFLALQLLSGEEELLSPVFQQQESNLKEAFLQAAQKERQKLKLSFQKLKDYIASAAILTAEELCDSEIVQTNGSGYKNRDKRLDLFLTGRLSGAACMLLLLVGILWLTISGANYPSALLWQLFQKVELLLANFLQNLGCPLFFENMLVEGVYRTVSWIVSVMLPPMAIFFPLFTFLEDVGYLPRIAFNLDKPFACCGACGKQALTLCMGLGCNAAGVTGCRIVESPRERLIAILTNSFVPCNGRFPVLIALITVFLAVPGIGGDFLSAVLLAAVLLLGFGATLLCSKLLSVTLLKGYSSSFILELPPYRKPKLGSIILRSVLDRTVFVLGRAVAVAAPAGLLIWLLANLQLSGISLLEYCRNFLEPFGNLLGLDGAILLGFILGFPANEIVLPLIMMIYLQQGALTDYSSLETLKQLFLQNGWDFTTVLCTTAFTLLHWPCSTTLLTVKKETGSLGWTALAFALPTVFGMLLCLLIHFFSCLF